MANLYTLQDPTKQYARPKFKRQPQSVPGLAKKMSPQPDHGEESYIGHGRLPNRKALVTGGDSIERFFNAIWHVWWAVHFKEYYPGLLTSLLILMESYWIVFCRPAYQLLPLQLIWPGVVLGLLAATFLSFYMPIVAKRASGR